MQNIRNVEQLPFVSINTISPLVQLSYNHSSSHERRYCLPRLRNRVLVTATNEIGGKGVTFSSKNSYLKFHSCIGFNATGFLNKKIDPHGNYNMQKLSTITAERNLNGSEPKAPQIQIRAEISAETRKTESLSSENIVVSFEKSEDMKSTETNCSWVPHRLDPDIPIIGPGNDWISPLFENLQRAREFRPLGEKNKHKPRVLVLYGTLRVKGFSKLLAYECGRIADLLDLDVRLFNPDGLPVRDPELSEHPKVVELRSLVEWSEGHVWVASELHGGLCSVFKNQIDWIPLNSGSIRPTQGKCAVVLQVCGGSQSFNVVNSLRLLARWMRMSCVVNQSSVPMAWKQFDDDGRMKEGSLRDRVVDVMEEFCKSLRINRDYSEILTDRYSERKETEEKGRLLTQAEKEAEKDKTSSKNN